MFYVGKKERWPERFDFTDGPKLKVNPQVQLYMDEKFTKMYSLKDKATSFIIFMR